MLRGFSQVVVVYFAAFKAVNRGSNHAHRHRLEILRLAVQELLIFEPWVFEISRKVFWMFPCITTTYWYIFSSIHMVSARF